jgi:hypothetical protein
LGAVSSGKALMICWPVQAAEGESLTFRWSTRRRWWDRGPWMVDRGMVGWWDRGSWIADRGIVGWWDGGMVGSRIEGSWERGKGRRRERGRGVVGLLTGWPRWGPTRGCRRRFGPRGRPRRSRR